MTALQVQQAALPPPAGPSRKLTREVSSAISESAAKRAEALAALEAQVAETKLSLEVGDIMVATAAGQQGRQSCLPADCSAAWTVTLWLCLSTQCTTKAARSQPCSLCGASCKSRGQRLQLWDVLHAIHVCSQDRDCCL